MITTPRGQTPEALHAWAIELVQELERERAANASGAAGSDSLSMVPIGGTVFWPGQDMPEGFLPLEGQLLEARSFPVLAKAFGTKWNGLDDPAGFFRLPNATDRSPRQDLEERQAGGIAEFTLTLAQLPEIQLEVNDPGHDHDVDTVPHKHTLSDPQHNHQLAGQVMVPGGNVSVAPGNVQIAVGNPGNVGVLNAATNLTVNSTTTAADAKPHLTGIEVSLPGLAQPVKLDLPFFGGKWIVRAA